MLNSKEMQEIKEHLENSKNPVFFYDNDADGLCSFILMRRFLGRGKGVAVRTHPGLDSGYAKRAQQLNADYVFVLDRHLLGKSFVDEIKSMNLPIVWIDHHDTEKEDYDYENIYYYNPVNGKNSSSEPVTYWIQKILDRNEDLWIAMMGCIADHHLPDFVDLFSKKYKSYWGKVREPFDAYFSTEIGKIARAIGFGLKDSITHVVYLQNILIKANGPQDVLLDLESSSSFAKKYKEIQKKYSSLIEKAKACLKGDFLFFKYAGSLSISSDLSNELAYSFPGKYIIVSYDAGVFCNVSIRGKNVNFYLQNILKNFESSSGGGHQDAVGSRIQTKDWERFKKEFEQEVSYGKRSKN